MENVLVSKKISFGEISCKCSIGYLYDDYKIKPLHIMLLREHVKSYDGQTKWMYSFIEDDDLLEKYNTIWNIFFFLIYIYKYIYIYIYI